MPQPARQPRRAPSEYLLRAQQASLSHSERIETLGLRALNRNVSELDVAGSLTGARVTLTIEGASTVELSVFDPDWKIEQSGFLDRDDNGRLDSIPLTLDLLRWRLAKAARNDPDTLTLTFEAEEWALMRAHRKHLAVSRDAVTRAQFIERMVKEIKLRDLIFWAPEKLRKQPVAAPDLPDTRPSGTATGFDKGTRFKIKGQTADPDQMREVATAMGVADQEDVAQEGVVRLAMLVAGIGESSFRDIPNAAGSPYGGVFQALKTRGMSTEEQARSFLKGGQGFQAGGAIAAHRANPSWTPGDIATHVEASGQPGSFYQQHHDEAAKIAGAWNGGDGGESTHAAVRVKSYRFTRGLPGQVENTVQCATRLADEVAWRFFALAGVVYFVSDYFLIAKAADLVLDGFDAPGLLAKPSYEWDHRKLAGTVTLNVAANAWGVAPGSVVELNSMGPIDGRWIIETFEFDLLNALQATVTLTKPVKPKKEPAPELFTVAVGDDTPAGGGSGGAKKAIEWARSKIGHYAETFGSNRGAELDRLEAKFNMQSQPWCAIFATTALVMGGVSRECRHAYVGQLVAWAREGTHGFQRGFKATPQPGDLFCVMPDVHTGLVVKVHGDHVETIEGNTGAGKVATGTRLNSSVTFIRPDYPD